MKELLMGNEAIAVGAIAAGVQVVAGYPGTPSSEVLETIAKRNPGGIHVEWSVNEKAGAEVAIGAAYTGARSMVTMKQMGLNVAADPIMSVNYIGTKGGLVIYVADDPGPISSQTEQDTRHFAQYAHIPCFDCDSPEQAFYAVQEAFAFSEKHHTPVFLRSTTRVCHACADVDVPELKSPEPCEGFIKDSKWVIFPGLSYKNKLKIAAREPEMAEEFSAFLTAADAKAPDEGAEESAADEVCISPAGNSIEGSGRMGIACGGISYAYVMDAIAGHEDEFTVLKIATPYPFPSSLARQFMMGVEKVLVFEELDPYIEDALIYEYGNMSLDIDDFIEGKRTETVPAGGELSAIAVGQIIEETSAKAFGEEGRIPTAKAVASYEDAPAAPVRPPVLCAGCPHRGSFYAVKKAVGKGQAIYCGDIGCYTLGNAAPLDMVDTCLCMGAGITQAQGLDHALNRPERLEGEQNEPTTCFAFVGDSTFFASGITGTVNAVYNQADMILCVLDNSTTAMTGHQPHPGMGITMMGKKVEPVDIGKVLEGIGVPWIRTVDPLDLTASVETVKEAMALKGVRAIIFKSPCIALMRPGDMKGSSATGIPAEVDKDKCISCMQCINQIGCPALITDKDNASANGKAKALIDKSLCTGCGLCTQICPVDAIRQHESWRCGAEGTDGKEDASC